MLLILVRVSCVSWDVKSITVELIDHLPWSWFYYVSLLSVRVSSCHNCKVSFSVRSWKKSLHLRKKESQVSKNWYIHYKFARWWLNGQSTNIHSVSTEFLRFRSVSNYEQQISSSRWRQWTVYYIPQFVSSVTAVTRKWTLIWKLDNVVITKPSIK